MSLAPIRCVACQMDESEAFAAASSSISFLTLAPCEHTMCSDCYSNPCTLVQCYGCPACGSIPTGTTTALVSSSSKKGDEKKVQVEVEEATTTGSAFDCTTTLDSLYYTGLTTSYSYCNSYQPQDESSSASYSYSYSYSSPQEVEVEEKKKVVEEEEVKMVEMTSSDIHEYLSTHGLTDLSCCSSGCSSTSDMEEEEVEKMVAFDEKEEVEAEVTSVITSEASSATKKRRRQKKAGKGPLSRWEGKNAKPSKAPTVIVPKDCPDHLRPKRKPAPTTCRQHGRRLEREETLRKIRRGKDEEMRKMREIGRDMSCC